MRMKGGAGLGQSSRRLLLLLLGVPASCERAPLRPPAAGSAPWRALFLRPAARRCSLLCVRARAGPGSPPPPPPALPPPVPCQQQQQLSLRLPARPPAMALLLLVGLSAAPPTTTTTTEVSPAERGLVLASCALSGLGSGLLVATHARWPELRTRPRQLLLYLSLADLLSAASYFYGALRDFPASSWDCVAQGALSTFANTSSFFWTMAIALDLYLTIVRGAPGSTGLLAAFHVVSWGIPLGITAAAVAMKKIGYDASDVSVGWCWINLNVEDRVLWMLLAGKVWEILAYVTLPIFYILIKKHINRAHAALSEYRPILSSAPSSSPRTSVADKKLTLIPVIFIFLRIWSTVRFVLTLCSSPAVRNPVLVVLHGIGNTFQGGANCIMFVLCTRVVRNKLLSCLCCWSYDSRGHSVSSPETLFQDQASPSKDWQESERARAEFSST
ncbi:G-protein coupled receptor 157 [Hemicordylus capensis]|uniref:G-protein coupled receptor 157 n=1 Tax=Hemicordylus capensis TaxID=884348 RepID=UPI002303B7EA|nr:G-protein coupled receptor 157 [Hemicordylus capensis]